MKIFKFLNSLDKFDNIYKMIKENASLNSFQMNKAFQEIDNKNSEIGNTMIDFKIVNELGRGSYGTVYKVQSLKNN